MSTISHEVMHMRKDTENRRINKAGSLTIEASLVMPLFMYLMICVISLMALLLFQLKLKAVMHEEIKDVAMKSIMDDFPSEEVLGDRVLEGVGELILSLAPVDGKAEGIEFSKEGSTDEVIRLRAEYDSKLYYDFFNLFHRHFSQTVLFHDWEGYINGINSHVTAKEEEYVYITNDSEVYHRHRDCSHIKLQIMEISSADLKNARNNSGSKYKSCEHCHSKVTDGTLYITKEGDKYHNSLSCSGLKRVVKAVLLSEVNDKRPCSRCGNR